MIQRYPLTTFFLLAFGITWVVWVPRAAGAPLDTVGQAWTWVPAIAALLAAALTGGREVGVGSRSCRGCWAGPCTRPATRGVAENPKARRLYSPNCLEGRGSRKVSGEPLHAAALLR